ncbi:MAG: hypothetical protein ACYTFQ_09345 [Planctomycetota bacterium]|jgi:hypothetical protein
MANIFGTKYESPQEAQKRLLRESLAVSKPARKNWASSLGYDLGSALARAIHGDPGKVEVEQAEFRQEAAKAGHLVQQQLEKQGMSEHEAQIKARAHTIAVLREKGDTDLAEEIQESTTKYLKEYQKEQADMKRIKAATAASEETTKESKQRQFLSKTEGQIQSDLAQVNDLMGMTPADKRSTPAYRELQRRQQVNLERLHTLREEEDKSKRYQFTDINVMGEDGKQYTQRIAVNPEDPTDTINLGDPKERQVELGRHAQGRISHYTDEYKRSTTQLNGLDAAIKGLENLDDAGWLAKVTEFAKDVFGTQDVETYVRTMIQSERVKQAISNLPPGVASDKDIELVMSGTIPPDAAPEIIRAYMRGLQKIERYNAEYSKFAADHVSNTGSEAGLIGAWEEYSTTKGEQEASVREEAERTQAAATQALSTQTQERTEIISQINQLQTALTQLRSQPGTEAAVAAYQQQLEKLSQQLGQLNQQVDQAAAQGAPVQNDDAMLDDILGR